MENGGQDWTTRGSAPAIFSKTMFFWRTFCYKNVQMHFLDNYCPWFIYVFPDRIPVYVTTYCHFWSNEKYSLRASVYDIVSYVAQVTASATLTSFWQTCRLKNDLHLMITQYTHHYHGDDVLAVWHNRQVVYYFDIASDTQR